MCIVRQFQDANTKGVNIQNLFKCDKNNSNNLSSLGKENVI